MSRFLAPPPILIPPGASEAEVERLLFPVMPPPTARSLRYSPDQPRDDHGRFTSGGGAGDESPATVPVEPMHMAGRGKSDELGMTAAGDPAATVWNGTARAISTTQSNALDAWVSPGQYKAINEYARRGCQYADCEDERRSVGNLDAAIARQAPTASETVLYHYVSPGQTSYGPSSHWTGAAPGTTLTEAGFVGTTPDVGTAVKFPDLADYPQSGALLEIHAPAGTSGLIASQGDYGFREVVLPRGSEFQRSGQAVSPDTQSAMRPGMTAVRVDIVGQEPMGVLP